MQALQVGAVARRLDCRVGAPAIEGGADQPARPVNTRQRDAREQAALTIDRHLGPRSIETTGSRCSLRCGVAAAWHRPHRDLTAQGLQRQ